MWPIPMGDELGPLIIEGVQRVHLPHLITHLYSCNKSNMEGLREADHFISQTDRWPEPLSLFGQCHPRVSGDSCGLSQALSFLPSFPELTATNFNTGRPAFVDDQPTNCEIVTIAWAPATDEIKFTRSLMAQQKLQYAIFKTGDQILIVKDLSLENLYSIFTVSGAESEYYDVVSVSRVYMLSVLTDMNLLTEEKKSEYFFFLLSYSECFRCP